MDQYWHKATGVSISEITMIELVRCGSYKRDEFEKVHALGPSVSLVEKLPPSGHGVRR